MVETTAKQREFALLCSYISEALRFGPYLTQFCLPPTQVLYPPLLYSHRMSYR